MKWIFFYSEVWLYVVNVLLSKISMGAMKGHIFNLSI